MEQPEGGLSGQRSGAQKVLGAEQHAHPCRQEKRPEGDANLVKDADKQAHSQLGPLQPVGAGGNQHRLQSHPVEIRRTEHGQQNREDQRSGQPRRDTFSVWSLYGQQPVNESQAHQNTHHPGQYAGEQQKHVRHMCAPQ